MAQKLVALFGIVLVVSGAGCGDDSGGGKAHDAGTDDGGTKPGTHMDASAGTGGKGGTGGAGGKGGTGGKGGSGGKGGADGSSADDLYTCKPAAPEAGGDALAGAACCGGLGVCDKNPTGPAAAGYGLDTCKAGEELKCVPALSNSDADAGSNSDEDGGTATIASCQVDLPANLVGDVKLEGRCVPSCFVTGDPSAANLGQSSCSDGSKCVPCYSPITAEATGACSQGGDSPAEPAPPGFAKCGDHDIGYCVKAGAAASSAGDNVMLPQLTCGDGEVCAPRVRVLDQHACFAHCESGIGGPGACIAGFIVPESTRGFLMQVTCDDGELCAPCVSPLDMMPTGACR